MPTADWLADASPALRLVIATSWLAPDSWRDHQEHAIRAAIAAGPDWAEYLQLVHRHQVTALSWAALSRTPGIEIPDPVKQRLRQLSDSCRILAMQHSLLLAELLKEFSRSDIPVVPLKGPILSFQLYGDIGLRQSSDLDIVVAPANLKKAQICIENLGWKLDSMQTALSPRQWDALVRTEHHINFMHSQTGRGLELHWRNHWETSDVTLAWQARSTDFVWQGISVKALHPGDLALYICKHGGFHTWSCAKWIGDLARAHAIGLVDWRSAFDFAKELAQEKLLLSGLYLLNRVYGLALPDLPELASQPEASWLTAMPLQALKSFEEPGPGRVSWASFLHKVRRQRYERKLCPRKPWRQFFDQLLYCREDFRVFPLPDSLFWAYKPLRPFLWLYRWARQKWMVDQPQLVSE